MTRISGNERDIIEQAIYLPMLLTVLHRDLLVVEKSPFKLKEPYLKLIKNTILTVQKELAEVKRHLYKNNIRIQRVKSDEIFTMYLFLYKGYEEYHNYFNPRLRNRVEELLSFYFHLSQEKNKSGRFLPANDCKAGFEKEISQHNG